MRAICRRYGFVPSLFALALVLALLDVPLARPAAAAPAPSEWAPASRWICRPDKSDVCDTGLDATVVKADGTTSVERWAPAAAAPVDCFYVYPTVSWDFAGNSDLYPAANQELNAARTQAARLGSACRVFAPVYRQVTATYVTTAYLNQASFDLFPANLVDRAYADVVASWRYYLATFNSGRGFVLVGHSQGSAMLSRLYDEIIRPDAAVRARLVSAVLLGIPPLERPEPSSLARCRSATQTGCLVAFNSYRSTAPPPATSDVARTDDAGECTNPAAPAGGSATLRAYFPAAGRSWVRGRSITTSFVAVPGLVQGRCVARDGFTWLEVTVNGVPADPRTDNIPGDLTPEFGLHLVDVSLVMGDLVAMVASQASVYGSRSPR
jgi:hypothetical protein